MPARSSIDGVKNRSNLPLPDAGNTPVHSQGAHQAHVVPPGDPRPAPPGPDVFPAPIQDPPVPKPPDPVREPPPGNPPTTAAPLRRVAHPQGTHAAA